jgi:hypothetical protein
VSPEDLGGSLIDLDAVLAAAPSDASPGTDGGSSTPPQAHSENRFVAALMRYWIGHMKGLGEDGARLAYLGLSRAPVDDLVAELITAADRLGLERDLTELLAEAETQAAAKRTGVAERQVYVAHARIARFVDYLGCDDLNVDERPRSRLGAHLGVFEPPPKIPTGALPQLAERPTNYSARYVVDWFEAFRALAIANAGHAAGQEIAAEDNVRLGSILARIQGRAGDAEALPAG